MMTYANNSNSNTTCINKTTITNALAPQSESDKAYVMPVRQRIRNPRSNVPPRNLKWSLDRASREFKFAPNTLRKYLHQGGVEADEDGCFSTLQICACVYGDLRSERLRKEGELTKRYALQNAITEGSVLDRHELMRTFSVIAAAMVTRINSATELSRNVREDLLRDLATWPDAIKEVAHRQTRLPHRGNGQEDDQDDV
jgi:hypothetical protein